MKFLTFILAFLLTSNVFANAFGNNSFDGTGAVVSRYAKHTFVKNSASAAFAQGEVVCHDLTAEDGISADLCASTGDPAAYCMVTEACAVGNMCKCLVEGYTGDLVFQGAGDSASTGDAIYADDEGFAAGVTVDTTAEAAYRIIGTFLEAASSSVDVKAYLSF